MSPHTPTNGLNIVLIVGVAIVVWYVYQIASRKRQRIRYKIKRSIVALVLYGVAASILIHQGLPPVEVILISALAGMGCAWLLVSPPRHDRRISAAVRRAVIARDLTSKGLKWDPARHHIDHIVPFSRGGDNSVRNLRVMEKQKNLLKGGKMPGFRDFLRK
jgi:hypothetical protein